MIEAADHAIAIQLITSAFTFLTVVAGFVFQWLTGKKREARTTAAVTKVQTTVNGHSEKIIASNEALKQEVKNLQIPGSTTPSATDDPGAPVTLDRGIVSTEKKP